MKIVDVNVLLYAINERDPHHSTSRDWLIQALNSVEPIGLAWITIVGFLRIATNPRIFVKPCSPEEAIELMKDWLGQPNMQIIRETNDHWTVFQQLVAETKAQGDLITDAHLATLAISRGATFVSCDADFRRFPQLRLENPLD